MRSAFFPLLGGPVGVAVVSPKVCKWLSSSQMCYYQQRIETLVGFARTKNALVGVMFRVIVDVELELLPRVMRLGKFLETSAVTL